MNIEGGAASGTQQVFGLSAQEVTDRRALHGENILTPPARKSFWRLYAEKFCDPIIKILIAAALVSLVLSFIDGEFSETIGIFLAIFLATTIGFYFERDAARRFNILTAIGEEARVKVIRDGVVQQIGRREVVVGDVVLIDTGDEIPADGRLIEATELQIDESALTGESIAYKSVSPAPDGEEGAYPANVVLRSTMVMGGTGKMIVTAVGDDTEIGHVARTATEITAVETPLNIQLTRLAGMISKVGTGVAIAALVCFLVHDIVTNPVWHTDHYMAMAKIVLNYFMMSVTLLVVAVPEGLPMAVTLALALNMRRMLKSNNLVRRLHASETMGAVTTICTDKTGTLTQNKMRVADFSHGEEDAVVVKLLDIGMAVNSTAELRDRSVIGNPTEGALLLWLKDKGVDYREIRRDVRMTGRVPFSTERKYMATTCEVDGHEWMFIKGAPEIVMGKCDVTADERDKMAAKLAEYQQRAMRTIAFACKRTSDIDDASAMTLQGIAAIKDPVREDVPEAVARCRAAGIDIKVVTGDTAATAVEIARQAGIVDSQDMSKEGAIITGPEYAILADEEAYARSKEIKVMSRARPTDKMRLVSMLQKRGEVVAVTGDGTNDAPALNHAHVGLSLGSGTAVAKNASDMTLIDDSFHSIVMAVKWGRSLYRNIQRFVFFQLIVNVTALLLVLGGSITGTELPLTIPQMLWINLIMDTFAAIALASLPPEEAVMREKPRSQNAFIISKSMGKVIMAVAGIFFLFMIVMLAYYEHVVGLDIRRLTIFFTVFVMVQWWNLLNAKAWGASQPALSDISRSKGMLFILALIIIGQWAIVTFGGKMFRTVPLDFTTWLSIIVVTSPVLIIGEGIRWILRRRAKS